MPCGSDRGKVRMLPIEKGRIWMEWKCKKTRREEEEGEGEEEDA